MTDMQAINRWALYCEGRLARARADLGLGWTPYLVDPLVAPPPNDASQIMTVNYVGAEGTIVLTCPNGYAGNFHRPIPNYPGGIQFQAESSSFHLKPIPTGDGWFILGYPDPSDPAGDCIGYLTIGPPINGAPADCNILQVDLAADASQAARCTANGLDRGSVLDFVQVSGSATGMSFAGVDVTNVDLGNVDLSLCDFRQIAHGSFSGCSVGLSTLHQANFTGLHLAGLQMPEADFTGADFTDCDFTSITPSSPLPPPSLANADLTSAVIPGGTGWSAPKMPGAVLAETTLTGADLSGADLSGADFSGTGVRIFSPAYQGSHGIDSYDLLNGADRVIAFDYDANPSQPKANYLVCYRPGHGACAIVYRSSDANDNVTFDYVYFQGGGGSGIGGYNLSDPADQIIAFDYNSTGNIDHLVCYRPGAGIISVIEKKTDANNNVTFDQAWGSTSGIGGSGGCDLSNPADRIIAYDYAGTGHLDHLLCYRPGTGEIWILEKDTDQSNNVTFTVAFASTNGIGGYPLGNAGDLIVAIDYNSTRHLDHLVCYRPGSGAISIVEKQTGSNNAVTFASVFTSTDGIGGCDMSSPADRIIALDYNNTGHLDHLVCYRPAQGTVFEISDGVVHRAGTVWIVQKRTDQQKNVTFTPVYHKSIGIGGYDLSDPRDQLTAYDYAGADNLDALVCYRPGTGTIWVIQSRPARPATLESDTTGHVCNLTGADLTSANLAGTKLDGVNLSGATLAGTDFTGTDLTQVAFSPSFIRSADPDVPTIFAGCTVRYASIGLDWSNLDLTSATLLAVPSDLTGLVAVAVRFPGADFTNLVLDGANFASATLDGAHFTLAKLRQSPGGQAPSFAGATLTSAYFTEAVLDQVDFSGATLGGLERNQGANFSSAWISNCTFTDTNAYAVVFSGATLVSGNTLTGVANLQESDFSDAYLPGTKLTGASLQGATFDGACMVGCDLTNAVLTPAQDGAKVASLTSACLQGALFTGTGLDAANLTNAAITDQVGDIPVTHYDEDGSLIGPEPLYWRAQSFPSSASFTDATVCPDASTFGSNQEQGLPIAKMMQAKNPPTKWAPVAARRATAGIAVGARAEVPARQRRDA